MKNIQIMLTSKSRPQNRSIRRCSCSAASILCIVPTYCCWSSLEALSGVAIVSPAFSSWTYKWEDIIFCSHFVPVFVREERKKDGTTKNEGRGSQSEMLQIISQPQRKSGRMLASRFLTECFFLPQTSRQRAYNHKKYKRKKRRELETPGHVSPTLGEQTPLGSKKKRWCCHSSLLKAYKIKHQPIDCNTLFTVHFFDSPLIRTFPFFFHVTITKQERHIQINLTHCASVLFNKCPCMQKETFIINMSSLSSNIQLYTACTLQQMLPFFQAIKFDLFEITLTSINFLYFVRAVKLSRGCFSWR